MVIARSRGAVEFDESGQPHAVDPDSLCTAIGLYAGRSVDDGSGWVSVGSDAARVISEGRRNAGPWRLHDGQWRRLTYQYGKGDVAIVRTEWRYGPKVRSSR